ncbi:hypothetical protein T4D_9662 [Trichinella pseudospiralis]|uniref:Secreted protein n=1 Tax=Trichinella pseudospiralis TaxID=6337 RepID=A0A0V1FPJ6_TRIPS|nr:hypothetical protein T4D_9662 [Trichinella pseudospiralis]
MDSGQLDLWRVLFVLWSVYSRCWSRGRLSAFTCGGKLTSLNSYNGQKQLEDRCERAGPVGESKFSEQAGTEVEEVEVD